MALLADSVVAEGVWLVSVPCTTSTFGVRDMAMTKADPTDKQNKQPGWAGCVGLGVDLGTPR